MPAKQLHVGAIPTSASMSKKFYQLYDGDSIWLICQENLGAAFTEYTRTTDYATVCSEISIREVISPEKITIADLPDNGGEVVYKTFAEVEIGDIFCEAIS